MELFAIKLDDQSIFPVLENETLKIVGYLEEGEKGFYIHLTEPSPLYESPIEERR
jgi:hypothetical protein